MSLMLCSLNELKDYLRVPQAESSLDSVLTKAVGDASAEGEKNCDRAFLYAGHANETYQGGGGSIVARQWPIDPAATFQVKDYDATNALIIFDTADYAVDYTYGVIRLRGGLRFTHGPDSAQLTYSAGYNLMCSGDDQKVGVPDGLSRDVRNYAAALYREQTGSFSRKDVADARDVFAKACAAYSRVW